MKWSITDGILRRMKTSEQPPEGAVILDYPDDAKQIDIPEGTTEIGDQAFVYCYSIERVSLPEGVTSIGYGAFDNCHSLSELSLPNSVRSIGETAFYSCHSLKRIVIPEGVRSISRSAFDGCISLKEAVLPESVTEIGIEAFCDCKALVSIIIPQGVTSIGARAFFNCVALTHVSVPEGVREIGAKAFDTESSPMEITITGKAGALGVWSKAFTNAKIPHGELIVHTQDISTLPPKIRTAGIRAYARDMQYDTSKRSAANEAFISKNAAKMVDTAFDYPEILELMCREGLISAKARPVYMAEAERRGDPVLTDILADTGRPGTANVSPGDPAERIAAGREKVMARAASFDANDYFMGRVYALEGTIPYGPAAPELILKSFGASVAPSVTDRVDVLLTVSDVITPARQFAEALGIRIMGLNTFIDAIQTVKTLKIPEGVKKLPAHAFLGMKALEHIELPQSLLEIRPSAFGDCDSLGLILVPNGACKVSPDGVHLFAVSSAEQFEQAAKAYYDIIGFGDPKLAYLGNIDDLPAGYREEALYGFLHLEIKGDERMTTWQDSYRHYVRASKKHQLDLVNQRSMSRILPVMTRLDMITPAALPDVRKVIEKTGTPEDMAVLLEYENSINPAQKQRARKSAEQGFERQLQNMAAASEQKAKAEGITGLTFVLSGDMPSFDIYHDEYTNAVDQSALKAFIEARGGHLRGNVSGKTNYLICNNPNGNSTKLSKARELGVEIISEDRFLAMAGVVNEAEPGD